MKKIVYYIFAGLLVLAMASCNKTMEGPSSNSTTVPPAEGTLVKVEFEATYPGSSASTKAAMAEMPAIENLYLAVFSEDNGYLQNWIPAEIEEIQEIGVNTMVKYKVYLPITTNEIFHFIADPPIEQPSFDYENDFIKLMVTTDKEGAYWQRVIVPGGVKAAKKSDGTYDLDENGNYKVDSNSIKNLQRVALVRNYAKIVVKSADESEFKVTQYALGNIPTSGTVAPWNTKTSGEEVIGFDIPYTEILNYMPQRAPQGDEDTDLHVKGRFYDDLTVKTQTAGYTGYSGTMPADVEFNEDMPTSFVSATAEDNGLYMYERTLPNTTQQPTVILMEVEWQNGNSLNIAGGTKQWYKVELLDNDGEFMPILRHIRYTLSLSGIKESGKTSKEDAWKGSALGNISSSLETAMLNDISDGTSRLLVENLDYTFFTNVGTTTLDFQFYPDADGTTTVNKTGTYGEETVTITISRRDVDGHEHAVSNSVTEADVTVITHDDGTQWGSIPLTINPLPEAEEGQEAPVLKSVIRVQGKYGKNRAIYREVTYTVMGQQQLTDKTTVKGSSDAIDQPVTVTIGIPKDLPSDIFPLQFRIEAKDNNLSTTDPNLPVQDGLSTFEDKQEAGKRSFYYIATIKYTEYKKWNASTSSYDYKTEWPFTLYTTKTSGNGTDIRLSINSYDQADWTFAPKTLTLKYE
jgi:hypothetical protein